MPGQRPTRKHMFEDRDSAIGKRRIEKFQETERQVAERNREEYLRRFPDRAESRAPRRVKQLA